MGCSRDERLCGLGPVNNTGVQRCTGRTSDFDGNYYMIKYPKLAEVNCYVITIYIYFIIDLYLFVSTLLRFRIYWCDVHETLSKQINTILLPFARRLWGIDAAK